MNAREISALIGMVRALCPAQKFDEYTPDAWLFVLDDVPFPDARDAIRTLGRQLHFIAPSDIAGEVRRVRNLRASSYAETEPDAHPDDVAAYVAAIRDGRFKAASGELPARPVMQAIEPMFQRVESKWNRHSVALPAPPSPAAAKAEEDPELADAQAILKEVGSGRVWMIAARTELEDAGEKLTHRAVVLRAADLATRPEAEVS